MSMDNDAEYYRKRERQAVAMARSAIDPSIRAIHLEMAKRYAERILDDNRRALRGGTLQVVLA